MNTRRMPRPRWGILYDGTGKGRKPLKCGRIYWVTPSMAWFQAKRWENFSPIPRNRFAFFSTVAAMADAFNRETDSVSREVERHLVAAFPSTRRYLRWRVPAGPP